MKYALAYHSHVGRVREQNEDMGCVHQFTSKAFHFLAVADGMGGHEGGEIASSIAIETLESRVGGLSVFPGDPLDFLASAFRQANEHVYRVSQSRGLDMGTTLTAGLLADGVLFIAHVGDSRVYCITRAAQEQITADHSWVAEQVREGEMTGEEAKVSQYRTMLTRYMGQQSPPEVALYQRQVSKKETYLFSTDGLHDYVSDEDIHECVRRTRKLDRVGKKLIGMANAAGGQDNITVALLRVK